MAAGCLPVCHHPEHHRFHRLHVRHKDGPAAGAQRLGRLQGLLGSAELLHADGPGAGVRLRHGRRQALQKGPAGRRRSVPQQYAGHRGHHLHLHHLLLAELGLRPDRRHPAGQGNGAPGPHRGLSPADCLRLFGLRHLARGPVRLHPPGPGAGRNSARSCIRPPSPTRCFTP